MKPRRLFISHSWSHGAQYRRLVDLLKARPWFSHRNYSVPRNDPIHQTESAAALRGAIRRKIEPCHVVLVLAGVYATYSRWINVEVALAKELRKPIVAVAPWRNQRISAPVRAAADRVVAWNTESVVRPIGEVSR